MGLQEKLRCGHAHSTGRLGCLPTALAGLSQYSGFSPLLSAQHWAFQSLPALRVRLPVLPFGICDLSLFCFFDFLPSLLITLLVSPGLSLHPEVLTH